MLLPSPFESKEGAEFRIEFEASFKAAEAARDNCTRHHFTERLVSIIPGTRWKCTACGWSVSPSERDWYERGVLHHG